VIVIDLSTGKKIKNHRKHAISLLSHGPKDKQKQKDVISEETKFIYICLSAACAGKH
jgi:hypothetical protein